MRQLIMVGCYGLALGLIGLALFMIRWGISIEQGILRDPSLAAGILYSAATFKVMVGIAALVGGGLFAGAGRAVTR